MSLFVNYTKRSADEMLADLASCRQFRHLTAGQRQEALEQTGHHLVESRASWATKYPNHDNLCIKCGEPRSKFSTAPMGLCRPCYMTNLVDYWSEDVFTTAIELFGFSCDLCNAVFEVHEIEQRFAAKRCLENFDGVVKLILCPKCTPVFKSFCAQNYGRFWRRAPMRDQEKMAIAWMAQKVKVLAENVKRGAA